MKELEGRVPGNECLYTELRDVCKKANIGLSIGNARKHVGTGELYFEEQTAVRNWGMEVL